MDAQLPADGDGGCPVTTTVTTVDKQPHLDRPSTPTTHHQQQHQDNSQSDSAASSPVTTATTEDFDHTTTSQRSSISSFTTSTSAYSPNSSPQRVRSRRDKEANQQIRFRLQRERSASAPKEPGTTDQQKNKGINTKHKSTLSLTRAETESGHEQSLLRMAFTEQQKWVTVQQKTFTKW